MKPDELRHQLLTVVVADVVASSLLMSTKEHWTLRQFWHDIDEVAKPLLEKFHGRLVKTTGDGFIAVFSECFRALEFSKTFQKLVDEQNTEIPATARLQYRFGVNSGNIVVEEDDVFGGDVAIAVRIQQLAEPGGIVITDASYRCLEDKLKCSIQHIGPKNLRNIPRPVVLHKVLLTSRDETRRNINDQEVMSHEGQTRTRSIETEIHSRPAIAVLPFLNLSEGESHERFCEALTIALVTNLFKFKNISVIAPQMAKSFQGSPIATEIPSNKSARYLILGSIQIHKNFARVSIQFVDARSNEHLWADNFEESSSDPIELHDMIIRSAITKLSVMIDSAERQRALQMPLADLTPHDAFLRGYHLWQEHQTGNLETEESLVECRKWLELSRSMDPSFPRSWSTLAYSFAWGWRQGWDDDATLNKAIKYASVAVGLDQTNYDSHWDLAYCYLTVRNFDGAKSEYECAYTLNPNDPLLIAEIAEFHSNIGQHQKGLSFIGRAMRLGPYIPDYYYETKAWILYFLKDYNSVLKNLDLMRLATHNSRLLRAASHAQQSRVLRASSLECEAATEMKLARAALSEFLQRRPGRTIEQELRVCTFKLADDEDLWRIGLQECGLPSE